MTSKQMADPEFLELARQRETALHNEASALLPEICLTPHVTG